MSRSGAIGAALLLAALIAGGACSGGPPESGQGTATPRASTGDDQAEPRDLADLARRLRGRSGAPTQQARTASALGDEVQLDLIDLPADPEERPSRRVITAVLRQETEHGAFFVETDAVVSDEELGDAARVFEEEVWPKVTGAFGLPPTPGIDGDPRVAVLHADLGSGVGGYVSGEDAYPRWAAAHSNEREIVYMNLSVRPLGSTAYAHVLAHELQHVIHGGLDADEESWVNEGLSEVAGGLVSGSGGPFGAFLERPDTQLSTWSAGAGTGAHYAASSLFFAYLLEQTGGDALGLAAEPADGVAGVRNFLREGGAERSVEELVADWAVANELDEPSGRYGYRERDVGGAAMTEVTAAGPGEGEVGQFATDYLELRAEDFAGGVTLGFEGETEVAALAGQATANGAFWWAGQDDSADATLTRELDLTDVESATLTFRTWFDIERWFDFGYVEVSTDGGERWTALAGERTGTDDPLEVSYGPGYSGRSGGGETPRWVEERIDLTPYAGSRVLLRFEYLTDDNLSLRGWAIDDIAVPEIGYLDSAEADAGGWQRRGFRRVTRELPQRFELRLITYGAAPTVAEVGLDGANRAEVDLSGLGADYQRAVLVVVGTTEGTTERAGYSYEVTSRSVGARRAFDEVEGGRARLHHARRTR